MPPGGQRTIGRHVVISLCAACTGCIYQAVSTGVYNALFASALPARGASVRPALLGDQRQLCLGAACTGCIDRAPGIIPAGYPLPRRCLHGVHLSGHHVVHLHHLLCLGAACTGCIGSGELGITLMSNFASALPARGASDTLLLQFTLWTFASALPARGASWRCRRLPPWRCPLPRRCLHGVHRHSPVNANRYLALPRRCLHGVHPAPHP